MTRGKRFRVGLLFGGRSPEHEISIATAASIAKEADPDRLEIVPIYLTRTGSWVQLAGPAPLARLSGRAITSEEIAGLQKREVLLSGAATPALVPVRDAGEGPEPIDLLFPALHGAGGEDGSVQGLAALAGIPCVGAGILGSALGMDKITMKRVLSGTGIPLPRFIGFAREDWHRSAGAIGAEIEASLRLPLFVKPSGSGSSVGITKVRRPEDLDRAVEEASRFDYRILVEEGIDARELEVGILGNDAPEASVVGEIIPGAEFYDYRAKYIDEGSRAVIPAEIPKETAEEVRSLAVRAFRVLDLSGLARVDFLLERKTGKVYFNEVNTIPGFTTISMYPMLWQAAGVSYRDLISRLVDLAIERHAATRVEAAAPEAPGGREGGDGWSTGTSVAPG